MKKKVQRFKKGSFIGRLVCFLLAFQLVSMIMMPAFLANAAGEQNNDSKITLTANIIGVDAGIINRGEPFELKVTLKNGTNEKINIVSLHIDKVDGLVPIDADWTIPIDKNVEAGGVHEFESIKVAYSGSSEHETLTIGALYKIGDSPEKPASPGKVSFFVFTPQPSDPAPTDPSKLKPELKIKPGIQMPVVNAGDNVVLSFPIINSSSYEAKDITVSIDTSNMATLPFTFEQVNLSYSLRNLAANKEDNIKFNVKVKPDMQDGIYPIVLNYKFSRGNIAYSSNETIFIKVKNDKIPPRVILDRVRVYSNDGENPLPGSMASLTLQLKNQGDIEAKDIKVSLDGLSSDGIYVTNSAGVKYISAIEGKKTQDVGYFIYVSDKFKGNNTSLSANIEYKDNSGKAYNEKYDFFVKVAEKDGETKEEKSPELTINNLTFPREKIDAGDDFNIGFSLENIGSDIAKNVKISLTCENGILPISNSVIFIDSLDKGKTEEVKFNLYADKTATTKNHSITINVEYESEKDEENESKVEKYTLNRYAGVYVEKIEEDTEEKTKTVPKIIISMYNFEPEEAKAGENFKLKLSFLNTSKVVPIRNVKVTFSAKEGIFIPTNSSNTFFIENMGVQGSAEREVELFTKADAQAKSHILNLSFEYEDEKGNQYTAAEEISIPVKQEQRLVLGQMQMPPDTMEGQPIPMFMDFFNMGKSTLYNLMVNIEGEGLSSENGNYFVGNFEPGRSDYYEVMITPTVVGEVTGNVVFSYEDESGKKNEIRKDIKLNVTGMEMPPMPPEGGEFDGEFPGGPMPEMPQEKKLFTPLNIGIASGSLLIIVIVLVVIIKKRRARKAGMMLDE